MDLAVLAQSGLSQDGVLTDSLSVLRRRLESASARPVTVERDGPTRLRISMQESPLTSDAQRLDALLTAGGKLEFRKIDLTAAPAALKAGQAPPGTEILPTPDGYTLLAVLKNGSLSGDHVKAAQQDFGEPEEEPVVNIIFDDVGKRQFSRLTTQMVGRPIAIVLDDRVLSAPVVNEPVTGGMVQIAGGFTVETARQMADLIQAGHLPVSFTIVENKAKPRN